MNLQIFLKEKSFSLAFLCILTFFLGSSQSLHSQIVSDLNGTFVQDIDQGTTTSIDDFIVPQGEDRLLAVFINWISVNSSGGADMVDSVKYNNQLLIHLGTEGNIFFGTTNGISSIYYLLLGSGCEVNDMNDIEIFLNNSSTSLLYASAISFQNVDQSNPIGSIERASSSGGSSTLMVPTSPNHMIIDGIMAFATVNADASQDTVFFASGSGAGASYELSTGGVVDMDWTLSLPIVFAHIAAELNDCTSCVPFPGAPNATTTSSIIDCDDPLSLLDGNGSSSGAGISYEWTRLSGSGNFVGDSTMITSEVDGPGVFRLIVSDSTSGCDAVADETVIADLTPPAAMASGTFVDCNNPISTLDGSGSDTGGNITYQWSKISGTGNLVGPTNMINAEADGPGEFRLTVTNTTNACTNFADATVMGDLTAPISMAMASVIDCPNPTSTLDGTGSDTGGNITYQWTKISGAGNLVGATNLIMAEADAAGVFQLTVTNTTNGCTSTADATVTGDTALPTADAGNQQQIDCANASVLLDGTGSSQGNGETYIWTGPNVINGGNTLTPEVGASGTYTLTVTGGNLCVNTSMVNVIEDLTAPTADAGTDKELVCGATTIALDGTNSSQGISFTYNWTGPNVQSGGTTLTPTVAAPGTYTLEVFNSDNSCTSTADVDVIDIPSPTAFISSQTNVDCFGNSTGTATASGSDGKMPYGFSWSTGGNMATETGLAIGTYDVTLTDADGCTSTTSVTISEPDILTTTATSTFVTSPSSNDGTATAVPVGGTPPYSFAWSNGGNTQTITGLSPNYYTVTVTDVNGCQDSYQILVNVDLVVQISADGPTTFCFGENTDLTANASNIVSYDWNNGATNETINVIDSGIYSVTVTDQFGITAEDNVFIDVLPLPNIMIAPNGPNQFCEGDSVTLTASGGINYTWDDPNNTTGPVLTAFETNGYTVFGEGANGCIGEETFSVTAFPLPNVSIASATGFEFCEGTSVELEAIASNIADFFWSTGDTNMVFITVSETSTISLTAIDGNGCVNTTSQIVTEISEPNVQILPGNNAELCENDTLTLQATGGNSFIWNTGEITNTIEVTSAGLYSVTVAAGTGCSGSASTSVVVNNAPTAGISSSGGTEICQGTIVQLTATGGTSFIWNTGETTATIDAGGGVFSVTVTDDNGCSDVSEQEIKILLAPNVEVSPENPIACEGESVQLTANSDPSNTFMWSTGDNDQSIVVDTPGNYSVTVTDDNGCTNTSASDFTISAPPMAEVSPSDTVITDGNSVVLEASGGVNYMWNTGFLGSNLVVSLSGSYSVTVTDANGCTAVATATVQVTDAPTVNIQPDGPTEFCEGGSVILEAFPSGTPNFGFEWSTGETMSTISVNSTGIYSVTLTDGNGFQALASQIVTVNPIPDAPQISPTGNQNLCEGESLLLTNANAEIVNWQPGNIAAVSLNVSTPGTYYAFFIDGNNCQSPDSETVTVDVHPIPVAPVINYTPDTMVCAPQMVTLTSNYTTGNVWTNGSTDQSIVVSSGMDTYSVIHTDVNGCTSSSSNELNITVYPQPMGGITVLGETTICQDESTNLMGTGGLEYFWNVPGPNTQTITVSSSGTYIVTVVDANGCADTVSQDITVVPLPTPTISSSGDSLVTEPFSIYQWFFDGVALPNTNSQWIIPEETGVYSVTVIDMYGCEGSSGDIVGLHELEELGQINIYPNPTTDRLFIDLDLNKKVSNIDFEIINLLGQRVHSEKLNPSSVNINKEFAFGSLPEGTYYLKVAIENKTIIQKFVVSRN